MIAFNVLSISIVQKSDPVIYVYIRNKSSSADKTHIILHHVPYLYTFIFLLCLLEIRSRERRQWSWKLKTFPVYGPPLCKKGKKISYIVFVCMCIYVYTHTHTCVYVYMCSMHMYILSLPLLLQSPLIAFSKRALIFTLEKIYKNRSVLLLYPANCKVRCLLGNGGSC